jgi:hypothetical protein
MKRLLFLSLFVMGILLTLSAQTGQMPESFEWSMSLVSQREDAELSTERPVKMQTGDRISFSVKSGADCFVYVIVQDAENAAAALYNNPVKAGQPISLGPIRLAPPSGTETFFFIVSYRERPALRQAMTALRNNPASVRAGQNLLNEVYGLRREISQLRENPERPLAMGGSIRAPEEAGLLFSGAGTYVKIIAIEH